MKYDLRKLRSVDEVRHLFVAHHGYKSIGKAATYIFGVFEEDRLVAAYVWQPPPPGAAKAVCPEAPYAVLALSRMVAVPREERVLRHISKPLMVQMKRLIDRGRWPVLITYSDESLGHNGYVYQCSGWKKTKKSNRPVYKGKEGERLSSYSNGKHGRRDLQRSGSAVLQRWESWSCPEGKAKEWFESHGWRRKLVEGKRWASGSQAFTFVKVRGKESS